MFINQLEKDRFEIIKDDVRLDEIVQAYYGDLSMFDAVLAVNRHINTVHLMAGTQLTLPEKQHAQVVDVLW